MTFNGRYILDGKKAVPEPDLMKWAQWMERRGVRHVGDDTVDGRFRVSTVFLGLDHAWKDGPPILFETMVFPKNKEELSDEEAELRLFDRYSTWEEAEAGHAHIIAELQMLIAQRWEATSILDELVRRVKTPPAPTMAPTR